MRNLVLVLMVALMSIGCGPALVEKYQEIKPNQTAFVIPLEGANKSNQGKFDSEDYLNEMKVAAKRINIPQRKKDVGRMWFSYEWIPTIMIITVDRSPQTVKWVKDEFEATDEDAIKVESLDSIGFYPGVNITASINEENTAKFLYSYPSKNLKIVLNTNVRSKVQEVLSREFGKYSLDQCRARKSDIMEIVFKEVSEHFLEYGVTIDMLGLAGGLEYANPQIQQVIDDAFVAQNSQTIAQMEFKAQEDKNAKTVSIAVAERKKAEEFAKAQDAQKAMLLLEIQRMEAEAKLEMAKKWNGQLPEKILPQGSSFLFSDND